MDYEEFEEAIKDLRPDQQAFLSILFFSGCRVSEALTLSASDIACRPDTIYIEFFRLKGSKQTDPVGLPRTKYLDWLCSQYNEVFDFSRTTAWRLVKRVFQELYPHYFRMNRFTKVAEKFGLATMINFSGLAPTSVSHYIAKVDIGKVGEALRRELG